MSVRRAIVIGLVVVNGPVLFLLCGPLLVFAALISRGVVGRSYNWFGLLVFGGGFVVAWLWWSLAVPRWRLWAYERVADIARLKRLAVAVGLTWPDGHPFATTEIKSEAHARRERELEPPHFREPMQ